ncbi:MAG TPA: SMP-30/gluconolactonase/LRE family protein [Bryobacteraceae bacterium]|jgi:gluconolactonase|nr:SMP-30/gluconolactonase/LRE family protein [Bryobacteraceae bacterium]
MRRVPAWAVLTSVALAAVGSAQTRPARQFALRAKYSRFWKLVPKDAKLEKIAGDFGFTEGPVWDPQGFVYLSDESKNHIYRVFPDGRKEVVVSLGDPDGSTFNRERKLISTASVLRAIIEVDPAGSFKVLTSTYEGRKFNSPNDVVTGPDGALYFTDPTLDLVKGEKQEIPFQGVYRLGNDGSVTLLTKDHAQPNGLAFSPDGRRFYVDDSERRDIWVYDAGPGGKLSNGRLFGKEDGPEGAGGPDGMRVDRKGNIFVTGPLGIWIWDAKGNHLGTIEMPEQPANLAWGDPDYKTLYITATTSLYKLRTNTSGFVPYRKK